MSKSVFAVVNTLKSIKGKKVHKFVKSYATGKNIPCDGRTVNIKTFRVILNYEILFEEHQEFYDFHNPNELMDNFLENSKNMFVPTDNKVVIKCGLTLVFFQPGPAGYHVPITNIRYWSTKLYEVSG